MSVPTLAIDFGTSNSAAAVLDGNRPYRIPIESNADTLPTAVFFPPGRDSMLIGNAATDALIAGDEGRYMRALKSVLGTTLFHDSRMFGGKRQTLADIVAAFLSAVKARAESASGLRFRKVLSGRPIRFHSADEARNARAEADLRACYLAAGFESVDFMFEPEAAAFACHAMGQPGELGLIVDIGGGTSDFSLFRSDGAGVAILASHGIRLGGTDFDQRISLTHVMPRLGLGGQLRRDMGDGLLPVPNRIFIDLATWARIPFLYTAETRNAAADLLRHAVEPRKLQRLVTVLQRELGHDIAFAVERGKIAANAMPDGARMALDRIEPGLGVTVSPATLDRALDRYRTPLREAVAETCARARIGPARIATVILVGGSSLMGLVAAELRALCPQARLLNSEPFTAVVDGLALATARG
jgi:hypothetical chaperone protein